MFPCHVLLFDFDPKMIIVSCMKSVLTASMPNGCNVWYHHLGVRQRVVISSTSNHFLGEVKLTAAPLKNGCWRVGIWAQYHHRPWLKVSSKLWKKSLTYCDCLPGKNVIITEEVYHVIAEISLFAYHDGLRRFCVMYWDSFKKKENL